MRIIRTIVFNVYFTLAITLILNINLLCKYLKDYVFIILPILFVIFYLLGIFILADYKYHSFTWNRLFLKKYLIKSKRKEISEIFKILKIFISFNIYNLLAIIIINLRKKILKLKLHRGLR